MSHYDVLEVPQSSALEAIKASYQSKARKLHPDKRLASNNNQEEEEVAFLRIQRAWECLRDPERRKEYDASLALKETERSKSQELALEEWELVEEEETGDLCYVYSCRCGDDMWLSKERVEGKDNEPNIYMTCDGCSLAYHVVRPNS